ncbi:MAG: 50S ribosomal protein L6 [Ruminococcaceae bacterium]|nr:50S ribosomal protein L6 [Oscillospiraceae bacterium]
MSRIGLKPIAIPAGVKVTVNGNTVTVQGPKGTLTRNVHPLMQVEVAGAEILVKRPNDEKEAKSLHGLSRTLVANMVEGVTNGYKKELEISEGGYRVVKKGNQIVMNLGYSHDVVMTEEDGITFEVPDANHVNVCGIDKQKVGQVAAELRGKRPPEPYLGKGIKYVGERIRRKSGKAGK